LCNNARDLFLPRFTKNSILKSISASKMKLIRFSIPDAKISAKRISKNKCIAITITQITIRRNQLFLKYPWQTMIDYSRYVIHSSSASLSLSILFIAESFPRDRHFSFSAVDKGTIAQREVFLRIHLCHGTCHWKLHSRANLRCVPANFKHPVYSCPSIRFCRKRSRLWLIYDEWKLLSDIGIT